MSHKLVAQLLDRAENDKHESDFAYFFALLLAAEAITKTVALGILAAIDDDTEANRYRLTHQLVRANGLSNWSDAIGDALSGPASQALDPEAREDCAQLTQLSSGGDWQYEAVNSLKKVLDGLSINSGSLPARTSLTRWFKLFTTLRNKTRGHGATRPVDSGAPSAYLLHSIKTIHENLHLFDRPWVYLYRNLSGKYRVTPLTDDTAAFDFLKSESTHSLPNGVYVHFGSPKLVPLMVSDPDLSDFFLPNGGFDDNRFDLLSYVTDNHQAGDSSPFLNPPDLHKSETHGYGELRAHGDCFSNTPDPATDYVPRPCLENALLELLMDDRHPVVTLQGAGGVGKTSSTLQVVNRLVKEDRYEMIVWFSARDIDLTPSGPKTVKPGVLSLKDIASQYAHFVLPNNTLRDHSFDRMEYFQRQLGKSDGGECLFIFDNFETVRNPQEMFTWIEYFVRLPNKVLITTRLRDFKGDYPLEVHGMNEQEARTLIDQTVLHLNIRNLLTQDNINEVIKQSGGHPYVIKILLGEVADRQRFSSPRHVVAGSGEILTALFDRTFNALSPCGQRAFMTLSAWNSAVPRIALEAVLIGSTQERTEVENGIESLLHYSLAEARVVPEDGQEFISLPLAANAFGRKQLQISILRSAVEADVQILRMFSPSLISDVSLNLRKGFASFIENVSNRIDGGDCFSDYEPILNMVCRSYNAGWLHLAQWQLERGSESDLDAAISNITAFIQTDQNETASADAWRLLANAYSRKQNVLGEIHAFVERSQFDPVPFYDVSNTANLLNRRYGELEEADGRQQLVQRLLSAMENRILEASPGDLSRMAWLALHLSQVDKAMEFVERGLASDSQNPHCQKIAARLGISM